MNEAPAATWNIVALLRWTTGYFEEKGVSEPRASAEILLAHTLGLSRLDLYLRHDQPLSPEELARFKAIIVRRRLGEPLAYLTGHKEFWSLDFLVTPATLIPRPETEVLVEAVIEVFGGGGPGVEDP
jgi:release factor glutamine methyltransferase